jgi:hypothetical protein
MFGRLEAADDREEVARVVLIDLLLQLDDVVDGIEQVDQHPGHRGLAGVFQRMVESSCDEIESPQDACLGADGGSLA